MWKTFEDSKIDVQERRFWQMLCIWFLKSFYINPVLLKFAIDKHALLKLDECFKAIM